MMIEEEFLEPERIKHTMEEMEYVQYNKYYSEKAFWEKLKKIAKKAGLKVIAYALILFYVLQKEEVPIKEKIIIVGCLGYFILPFDFIADMIPIFGYSDDLLGMALAIKKCLKYVDKEVEDKVIQKLNDWFRVEYEYISKLVRDISR